MARLFKSLRRWRSAETVDTATSLWERFLPTPREIIVGVGTVLTSTGLGWWAAVQSALPFGIGLGVVVAVALRVWWINEGPRLSLADQPSALPPPGTPHLASSGATTAPSPPQPPIVAGAGADAAPATLEELSASVGKLRRTVVALGRQANRHNELVYALSGSDVRQSDIETQIAAAAKSSASATATLKAELSQRIAKLDEDLEFFRKRFDHFEQDTRARFAVRDADAALRELAGPIAALSERVLRADPDTYPDAAAWRMDVGEWNAKVQAFWNLAGRWYPAIAGEPPPSAREIMDVSHADYAGVKGDSGPVVPADFADQQLWRFMAVVSARHRRHAERTMGRVRDEATKGLHSRY